MCAGCGMPLDFGCARECAVLAGKMRLVDRVEFERKHGKYYLEDED